VVVLVDPRIDCRNVKKPVKKDVNEVVNLKTQEPAHQSIEDRHGGEVKAFFDTEAGIMVHERDGSELVAAVNDVIFLSPFFVDRV